MLQFAPTNNSSAIIQQGFGYWQSKMSNDDIPKWGDINPAEIKSLLPNIVVIQVEHNPLDFTEKITGDAILSRSRINSMGINWRAYEGRGPESKIWQVMEQVVREKSPSFHTIPYVGLHREFMTVETVALPLSDDGEVVTRIITFVNYIAANADDDLAVLFPNDTSRRFVL
jgi:PAS domain